jgi:hypothetical protein
MRFSVILAGLTLPLVSITASSAAKSWNSVSLSPSDRASTPVVMAVATTNGVVPEHHPLYHHYKHRYSTSTKSNSRRRR